MDMERIELARECLTIARKHIVNANAELTIVAGGGALKPEDSARLTDAVHGLREALKQTEELMSKQ